MVRKEGMRHLRRGDNTNGTVTFRVADCPERMTVAAINALLYLPGHSAGELDRALRISGGRSSRREIGTGKSACGYDSPATPIMRAHPDSLAFALRHGKRPPVPRQKHDPVLDLLTSSAFIRTDQRARLNRKLGKELGCHLHRKFLERLALQPREYSCSFVFDRTISSCRLWPEVILCMTGHEPA